MKEVGMKRFTWMSCLLFIVLLAAPGYALVVRSGQTIEIDEIIDDDLIIFAQEVDIKGKVNGDVYAFAQEVSISGEIEGSIFTGASSIVIDVDHAKTVWAAGGNINIKGNIYKNVIIAGGDLCVHEGANIGKDVIAYGGKFTVDGDIDGRIKGGVGTFLMAGKSGDIEMNAGETKIASGAYISGNLILESGEEPIIEEGAIITGETRLETREEEGEAFFALAPFFAFMITFIKIILLIAKIIVGIIIIALFKKYTRRIMDTLIKAPWKCLGWGFLALIVLPVATTILFSMLIGFPLAIFGSYVYSILFYLSSIFVALVVGEKIIQLFKKEGEISLYPSFIVGLLVLLVLGWIPILGFIIKLFVVLFGAGMLCIGTWEVLREMKRKKII